MKSMSEFQETNIQNTAATPRWVGLAIAALGGLSLIGIGVGWSALNHAKSVEQSTQASLKQQNDALGQRLAKSDDQSQQLQSDLKVVTDKLNVTQDELISARKQSKAAVAAYDKKLTGLASNVNTQLATKASTEDVTKLNGDVTGVKSDLDVTKAKLERSMGDMNVMSGLIARNHDDVEELRRRGDRNYFEFTLAKAKTPQRVGPVQMALNKTDPKKSKYTMTVLADDKSIEKKDKTAGEPVQFYVKGSTHMSPYEIVVFEVGKSQITGYLSTPKSAATAAASNTAAQ
jgi:predicted  nucleic acid-binding Zn-ribbon protein